METRPGIIDLPAVSAFVADANQVDEIEPMG
jgi:hypothetical protein